VAHRAGEGGKKWHKGCFKCSDCGVLLVLRNAQVLGGTIYCEKHKPTGTCHSISLHPRPSLFCTRIRVRFRAKAIR
jgi:hypothetical protein